MDTRKPRKSEPNDGGGEHWGLDPQDVRRYARRVREARAGGPLRKFFRIAAVALLLVGAFAVYRNFEAVRELRFDFSRLTSLFDRAPQPGNGDAESEPGTEVVGDTSIAGVKMPTSLDGEAAPAAEPPAAAAPIDTPAAEQPTAANEAQPAAEARPEPEPEPAPQPPPEPEVPAGPERFGFGLEVMKVSEADASARVLVLREGGRRGVSLIRWWTTNGTASAGADFARLEPATVRFAVGEQNRTLLVPIIGDRIVEGPENFFVHIAVGEGAEPEPVAQIEILIADDD
jgi:hypothetical protein